MEHIVDQDEVAVVDRRQVGGPDFGVEPDPAEVVPVEGNIEGAERGGGGKAGLQSFRQPRAAGVDADQDWLGKLLRVDLFSHFFDYCRQLVGVIHWSHTLVAIVLQVGSQNQLRRQAIAEFQAFFG